MEYVAGVDGCSAGWMVAMAEVDGDCIEAIESRICFRFSDVLRLVPRPKIIAVDMPIGLLDKVEPGGREPDRRARKILGGSRASSVFSPPTRSMLGAKKYEQVKTRGLTLQAFAILPKIREVDESLTAPMQDRIVESHPELVFFSIANRPTRLNKKRLDGQDERLGILRSLTEGSIPGLHTFREDNKSRFPVKLAGLDDILDAYALAWLALQITLGRARQLPLDPPRDGRGLRMEMWHAPQ